MRIRAVDLRILGEAAEDPAFAAAAAPARLEPGAPLEHGRYEQLKNALSTTASRRGYASAAFTASRIDVFPSERAADVTLHFDSGPRYRFGAIRVTQDVLSDRLVRAYIDFERGDFYEARRVTALYVELTGSGYFETVAVRPLAADHERQEIPVAVELSGAPRRQISYGVGFSTDTGPRLRFGRNNRRFNERGHQFELNAQLSPVVSEVAANYRYPYGDPRREWMSLDGGVKHESTDTSTSDSLELGARRVLERPGAWTRTQLLSLRVEEFEVGDQSGRSRLLMPAMEWSRRRGDGSLRPRNGSRLGFELRGASDALGSDTSFLQAVARGKWIWSVLHRSRFLVRGQVGSTREASFDALPPSVRFFAGGDDSIRGYAFQALGPVNEEGQVIGGSSLATASVEYEHPVRPRWSVAFFVDSGNAFERSDFEARTGAGLGLRWQSPLGPIRLDVGVPVGGGEDRDPRLHVSLGPDL